MKRRNGGEGEDPGNLALRPICCVVLLKHTGHVTLASRLSLILDFTLKGSNASTSYLIKALSVGERSKDTLPINININININMYINRFSRFN